MPSTNKTAVYKLNQWIANDQPQRTDFNGDNVLVEQALLAHDERIENISSMAESAGVLAWEIMAGLSAFNLDPTARGYLSENLSNFRYVDFRKSGAAFVYNITSSWSAFRNYACAYGNYDRSTISGSDFYYTESDLKPRMMAVDVPSDATLTTIVHRFYGLKAEAITGTLYIYRLDANDMPVEQIYSKSFTTPVLTSGTYTDQTLTVNTALSAGSYGVSFTGMKYSGGTGYGTLYYKSESYHHTERYRVYDFNGVGVAPVATTRYPLAKINWTYNQPETSHTVRTIPLDFGRVTDELSVYVRHIGFRGFMSVNAVSSSGVRTALTYDARYGADSPNIERFSGKFAPTDTVAVEIVLSPGAPSTAEVRGWYVTVK